MHEFWAWAKDNPFKTFILTWVTLALASKIIVNFLMIFQRRPASVQLTDEQFEAVREEVARQLTKRAASEATTYEATPERPRGRPWYERLS